MIEETLKKVIEAEKEAEEIIKKALEDAKNTVSYADDQAINIRNEARDKVKSERKQVVLQAKQDADEKYSVIITEGGKESASLKKNTSIKKASTKIAEIIFDKYEIK